MFLKKGKRVKRKIILNKNSIDIVGKYLDLGHQVSVPWVWMVFSDFHQNVM